MDIPETKLIPKKQPSGFEITEYHEGKHGRYQAFYSLMEYDEDAKYFTYTISCLRKVGA